MSKSEAVKFELEFLKIVFSTSIIALLGAISYAFVNYKILSGMEFLILSAGVAILALILIVVLLKTKQKISELRKMKKGD